MQVEIKKISPYQCEYNVLRDNGTSERIRLESKTFLVHDICHFVVEKQLGFTEGFWGMVSKGFSFGELSGKHNPITEQLRFVEQVVGPIQSTYLGNISKEQFDFFITHLPVKISTAQLDEILSGINHLLAQWQQLMPGSTMKLHW